MSTIEISDSGCSILYLCTFSFLAFITIQGSDLAFEYYVSEDKYAIALSPYVMMVHATITSNNIPNSSDDEWVTVNHDLYGTRSSNQTIINEENVDSLRIKWQIVNNFEIQEPPIIVGNIGYVQDYAGNVIAFNIENGRVLWNVRVGYGPTMGLSYDNGLIFSSTASNGTVLALNATDGRSKWESQTLGDTAVGYSIDSFPIVWNDYVLAGSGGSGLPPGPGMVKGNVTALNRTDGSVIWNLPTTTGEWVKKGKTPPNGGATAWSGGSFDPEEGILYVPLGSASPNFNASTRQTPNLYSNHMIAVNVTSGDIIWATPFIAHGTVLNHVVVPDTHDWDTSWGSSITKVSLQNGTQKKIVVGHDKMGNVIAMDGKTGEEKWWKTLGKPTNINKIPSANGTGLIWAYGVYNYHAVDDKNTLYITATNRGLNFFTDGISGHKKAAPNTIEQGLKNGTIYTIDFLTGETKWKLDTEFPPRVSPLVTNDILFTGYIPYDGKIKSGIILALDKQTGSKLWEFNVNAPIAPVGPSIANGILFVPTGKLVSNPALSSTRGEGSRSTMRGKLTGPTSPTPSDEAAKALPSFGNPATAIDPER
ncbi:MAG: PQQ-binding-like beta-propeller repeat protein, partial [Nitrososphaeraceae archaeon]